MGRLDRAFIGIVSAVLAVAILMPTNDRRESEDSTMPGSCTIFCVSYGGSVFMGNNEDWKNPLTYCWVNPPGDGEYGVLCFGFDDLGPQGGVNEKGLAFDGNALPYVPINSHPDRLQTNEAIVNMMIMKKCGTVEEAIRMARSYDWSHLYSGKFAGQYLLADATGDAAVIGFGPDGELAVTRKSERNGYIVSTNFNRAYPENRYGAYPCKRYDTACKMLETVDEEKDLTIDFLASVLNAVHEEGLKIKTLYSNIYDLKNGVVYVYHMHDYDRVCRLNVAGVIKNKQSPKRIEDLFPRE
jgi:hypothetical protein